MAWELLTWVSRCSSSGVRLASGVSSSRKLHPSDLLSPLHYWSGHRPISSYFFVPEVKGLSLEQIDLLYRESTSTFIAFDLFRAVPDRLFKFSIPITTADRCWKWTRHTSGRRRYAAMDWCFGLKCLIFTTFSTGRCLRGGEGKSLIQVIYGTPITTIMRAYDVALYSDHLIIISSLCHEVVPGTVAWARDICSTLKYARGFILMLHIYSLSRN